jgi:hypothetical protein
MTWPERLRALYRGNRVLSPSLHFELADHIESLTVEVERRARNEARLMNALDAIEALTKDTDGGDVDGDADIPVGELRRVLAEEATR